MFREILTMLSISGWRAIAAPRRLLHLLCMGVYHSKGIEDVFRALRRLCKKGSENHLIEIDRLYATVRSACAATFPNCPSHTVTAEDWEAFRYCPRDAVQKSLPAPLAKRYDLRLAARVFQPATCQWPEGGTPRRPADVPDRKTCEAVARSGQVGLQACVDALHLRTDGRVSDWTPVTHSWLAVFVPTLHEVKGCPPTILVNEQRASLHLSLTLLCKRCVLSYPLDSSANRDLCAVGGASAIFLII